MLQYLSHLSNKCILMHICIPELFLHFHIYAFLNKQLQKDFGFSLSDRISSIRGTPRVTFDLMLHPQNEY